MSFENHGEYLIKKTFRNDGILLKNASYNRDTIQKGYYIEYYTNGEIYKWFWYDKLNDYPLFGIYFDSLGNYIRYDGTPFIQSGFNKNEERVIEMVNPPNINFVAIYEDYRISDNKLFRKIVSEPYKTDSTAYSTFEEHKFIEGHKYILKYGICDKNDNIIDSSQIEWLK